MRFLSGGVQSATGEPVRIAVFEEGNPEGPVLVLVHGWPDSHSLWDGVVAALGERFRIIRYDNRGAGASTVPARVRDYTMTRLADDFAAVIDEYSPQAPVHVLAHDWGSVSVWEYLTRPGADTRVASFTSVSGPSTEHYGAFIRKGLSRPQQRTQFLQALGLAARFIYWVPFSVPVLAPALMRRGLARKLQDLDSPGAPKYRGENFDDDAADQLKIYRALFTRTLLRPRHSGTVTIPVQLICNDHDPVIRGAGFADAARWIPRLWRRDLPAGHWAPFSHPDELARAVGELVDHLDGQPAAPDLQAAEVSQPS